VTTTLDAIALAAFFLPSLAHGATAADLLPPEKAFRFTARALGPASVEARFNVADGYYLYRDKIRIRVDPGEFTRGVPPLPAGKIKEDEFFGRVETFRGSVSVTIPVDGAKPGQRIRLTAESQGCADAGVCYPPTVQEASVTVPAASVVPSTEPPKKSWFN